MPGHHLTRSSDAPPARRGAAQPRWARRVSVGAGTMMLAGATLNAYLVTARPALFRDLGAWLDHVSPWSTGPQASLWRATFGTHPRTWGGLVGVGFEAATGALALHPDPGRRVAGLAGVTAFHTGLLVMGLWAWALPVLCVVVPAAAATARARRGTRPDSPPVSPRGPRPTTPRAEDGR